MSDLLSTELKDAWKSALGRTPITDDSLAELAEAFRRHGPEGARNAVHGESLLDLLWFSIVAARTAFAAPEATIEVFDDLAASWVEGAPFRFETRELSESARDRLFSGAARPAVPSTFWDVVGSPVDPDGAITLQIAAFGIEHPGWLRDAQARAMRRHEGFEDFLEEPQMPRTKLDALKCCAQGTLGYELRKLILENGYDVEVLDPDVVRDYHPGHDAANRRILQTHEIFHLVAGYSTSPLHEVAISGFQLGQFGHAYSRDFLATALTLSVLTMPSFAPFGIQVALEGWRHGRRTPPLLPIDWVALWNEPISRIRERWRIEPYRSLVPDDPGVAAAAAP